MQTWKQAAVLVLGALAIAGVSVVLSRQLERQLLTQFEIDALERIPVLDEEPA